MEEGRGLDLIVGLSASIRHEPGNRARGKPRDETGFPRNLHLAEEMDSGKSGKNKTDRLGKKLPGRIHQKFLGFRRRRLHEGDSDENAGLPVKNAGREVAAKDENQRDRDKPAGDLPLTQCEERENHEEDVFPVPELAKRVVSIGEAHRCGQHQSKNKRSRNSNRPSKGRPVERPEEISDS